jgi:polyisoprenoid-binding protein YceI
MSFQLLDGSRVSIDLRAGGILRSLAHSPTLVARADVFTVALTDDQATVHARFVANAIEAPTDMAPGDREKMRENLLSPEVLDASRYPAVEFRGRYAGTVEEGTLGGELVVRGRAARVSIPIRVTRQWDAFVATGSWEGKLTSLGVKPYKALLGAIKLEDWIGLRLEARFHEVADA